MLCIELYVVDIIINYTTYHVDKHKLEADNKTLCKHTMLVSMRID
jgi:hypothetical protein